MFEYIITFPEGGVGFGSLLIARFCDLSSVSPGRFPRNSLVLIT